MTGWASTGSRRRRRWLIGLGTALAFGLVATSCYQPYDFTADHKADHIFVAANGDWVNAETGAVVFDGQPDDIPVPGDYDGNHIWDTAVVRPNGDWVTGSPAGTISFPAPAQLPGFVGRTGGNPPYHDYQMFPVPGDYDGDGTADPAWYRDSDGTWFVEGMAPVVFGSGPTVPPTPAPPHWTFFEIDQDHPVPADYDGDGITDLATFNPRTMVWKVRQSSTGTVDTVTMTGNRVFPLPVPADYDGVDHVQRAIWGPDGWSIEGHATPIQFGTNNGLQLPAVADYDGDNRADLSYTNLEGDTAWHTSGSATTYPVGSSFPLPVTWAVLYDFRRITEVGRCYYLPALDGCH